MFGRRLRGIVSKGRGFQKVPKVPALRLGVRCGIRELGYSHERVTSRADEADEKNREENREFSMLRGFQNERRIQHFLLLLLLLL